MLTACTTGGEALQLQHVLELQALTSSLSMGLQTRKVAIQTVLQKAGLGLAVATTAATTHPGAVLAPMDKARDKAKSAEAAGAA